MRSKRKMNFWAGGIALAALACGVAAAMLLRTPAAAKLEYYDLTIRSPLGLDSADVKAVQHLSDVSYAEGLCQREITVVCNGQNRSVTAVSISSKMPNLSLSSGRMPEQAGELVITDMLAQESGWKLGMNLTLSDEDFLRTDVVLVGTVQDRWNQGQVYLPLDNFMDKTFDAVYVFAKGADNVDTNQEEYTKAVNAAAAQLNNIRQERQQGRYETCLKILNQMIDEEDNLSHVKLDSYREQLDSAQEELNQAHSELEDGRKELKDGEDQLNSAYNKLTSADSQIQASEQQLIQSKVLLEQMKTELDASPEQLAAAKAKLAAARQQYQAGLASAGLSDNEVDSALMAANAQLMLVQQEAQAADAALAQARQTKAGLESHISAVNSQISALEATPPAGETPEEIQADQMRIDAALAQLRSELADLEVRQAAAASAVQQAEEAASRAHTTAEQLQGQVSGLEQLSNAKHQLAAAEAEYAAAQKAEAELRAAYETGSAQYNKGVEKLNDSKAQYSSSMAVYNTNLAKFRTYKKEYQEKLEDYQSALAEFEDNKKEFEKQEQEDMTRIQVLIAQRDNMTVPEWIVEKRTHE